MSFACRPPSTGAQNVPPLWSGDWHAIGTSPGSATASLTLGTDGTINNGSNDSSGGPAYWYTPTTVGIGSNYWVRMTLNSGDAFTTGTVGSYLQLSSSRAWTLQEAVIGTKTNSCTIQIATDSGGANVVASGTISFTAVVQP